MNILFKLVPVFIGFVFIIILAWFVFIGYFTFVAVDEIREYGIKSITSDIWCGKDVECKKDVFK